MSLACKSIREGKRLTVARVMTPLCLVGQSANSDFEQGACSRISYRCTPNIWQARHKDLSEDVSCARTFLQFVLRGSAREIFCLVRDLLWGQPQLSVEGLETSSGCCARDCISWSDQLSG